MPTLREEWRHALFYMAIAIVDIRKMGVPKAFFEKSAVPDAPNASNTAQQRPLPDFFEKSWFGYGASIAIATKDKETVAK